MKRALCLLSMLLASTCLFAQSASVARIMGDEKMRDYVWAIGYGTTLEEADKDAMGTLVSYTSKIVKVDKGTLTESEERYKQELLSMSNVYLENVRREVLPDSNGQKRVLRYLSKSDWEARDNGLKGKIQEYIDSGTYTPMIEDKMRYYVWAYVLLNTYNNEQSPITVEGRPAKAYLYESIREALNDITISVIAIEQDKKSRNYPYKVFLDFTYNEEPIGFLQFDYFDGSEWVRNESIKDGRGIVLMKQLPDQLSINIESLYTELARQLDPSVYILLQNPYCAPSFSEAQKRITTKPQGTKTQKRVDTSSPKTNSVVKERSEEINDSYVEIKEEVSKTKPFEKIMTDIAGSIQRLTPQSIRHHFTDEAWEHYQRIVASGNPVIARTPVYNYIKHDTLTICQSIPLKLRFSGNRSFVEDVVFRVNNRTMKVESVAYKLGLETEKTIMAMSWDDKARLTLIAFLEDYRTAYCLKDIDYIKRVFADDAYIIVGRVLKQSNKKFADNPYAINVNTTKTEYVRKSKQQYIYDLYKSFASKEFVNIRFEECNAAKGYYAKEGIYAVQLHQLYFSNNYADDGILTLAIDMREEANPLVRVRVWQQARDVKYNSEQMIESTVSVNNSLN